MELSGELGSKCRGWGGGGGGGAVWEANRRMESRKIGVTGAVNEAEDGPTKGQGILGAEQENSTSSIPPSLMFISYLVTNITQYAFD